MSAAPAQFPTATILAYPRIGRERQLKRALEARWAGRITDAELTQAADELRRENLARLVELGLGATDASLADAPSLYDHVLDATILLGAIPPRFAGRKGLDLYFALARGDDQVGPEEMTKWFDTNYHYLVPEIGPDTPLHFADDTLTRRFVTAREWGYVTRPVVVGPVTYLALAKADPATPDFDPLSRIDEAVAAYAQALASLHAAGAPWVQLDEPALTSDNLSRPRAELAELAARVYERLAAQQDRPQILLTTPYGDASDAIGACAATGVEAIHVDTLRGSLPQGADLSGVTLVVGAVDARYIWRADLAALRATLRSSLGLRGSASPPPTPCSMSLTTPPLRRGTIPRSTRTFTRGWPSLTRRSPRLSRWLPACARAGTLSIARSPRRRASSSSGPPPPEWCAPTSARVRRR